jgi:DNA-binding GntR family transcriptional regulator
MRALGVTIRVAKQMIGARQASANESNLLGTKPGGPVLSVTRTSYDTNGKAVEVGHHSYRPELYSFELTLVDKQ